MLRQGSTNFSHSVPTDNKFFTTLINKNQLNCRSHLHSICYTTGIKPKCTNIFK